GHLLVRGLVGILHSDGRIGSGSRIHSGDPRNLRAGVVRRVYVIGDYRAAGLVYVYADQTYKRVISRIPGKRDARIAAGIEIRIVDGLQLLGAVVRVLNIAAGRVARPVYAVAGDAAVAGRPAVVELQ